MPFDTISPDMAKQIEQLRLLYNRLFVPSLQDVPTMESNEGQAVTAPTIGLYPTQKGSDMPQVSREQLILRGLKSWNHKGGGPA